MTVAVIGAVRQAMQDRRALLVGALAAIAAAALFTASGQMVAWGGGRPVLLATSDKAAIFAALAVMVGLQATLQAFVIRLRTARAGGAAGFGGVLLAFVGASCCTPLIWPAVLSALGVSGVTLVGLGALLHQWFWIPVLLAAGALIAGCWQAARALAGGCALPKAD